MEHNHMPSLKYIDIGKINPVFCGREPAGPMLTGLNTTFGM
jgi:hypothetical protein